jgi:hypothetical protein
MRTEIRITVSGGIIQHITGVPPGVVVTVRDYDCDQSDDGAVMDEDGAFCGVSTWEAES